MPAATITAKQVPDWRDGWAKACAMIRRFREEGVPALFKTASEDLMHLFESQPGELRYAIYLWHSEALQRQMDEMPTMDLPEFSGLTRSLCAFANRHGMEVSRMWDFHRITTIPENSRYGVTWAPHSPKVDLQYEMAQYDLERLSQIARRLEHKSREPKHPVIEQFSSFVQFDCSADGTIVAQAASDNACVYAVHLDVVSFWVVTATSPEVIRPLIPAQPSHSGDFRSVIWYGKRHAFTAQQAHCVRKLWAAWESGGLELSEDFLMDEREAYQDKRLRNIFRSSGQNHPAWGTMIVPGDTQGTFKLAEPASVQ